MKVSRYVIDKVPISSFAESVDNSHLMLDALRTLVVGLYYYSGSTDFSDSLETWAEDHVRRVLEANPDDKKIMRDKTIILDLAILFSFNKWMSPFAGKDIDMPKLKECISEVRQRLRNSERSRKKFVV